MPIVTVSTTIPKEQRDVLNAKAASYGLKMNGYLRMLIENDLGLPQSDQRSSLEIFVRRIVKEEMQNYN